MNKLSISKPEIELRKNEALDARIAYKQGKITRSTAIHLVQPYVEMFNTYSKIAANKWKVRPKTITVSSFLRSNY